MIKGIVKNVTDYGAFVDLGWSGWAFAHVTDISWSRIKHPEEKLTAGQEISVKILKYDPETGRVNLGMKQLEENPWESAFEKFAESSVSQGSCLCL